MDHKKQHTEREGATPSPVSAVRPPDEAGARLAPHLLSPEDRAERVRVLKEQVQSGAYKPDTLEVAYILTRFLDPQS